MVLKGLQWSGWLAYLACCLIILESTIAEYRPGGFGNFYVEKGALADQALWRTMLHLHIAAGLICLFSALSQLSKRVLRRLPSLHRISGKLYGLAVIFLLCPTGFYLGLYAKGGLAGQLGFLSLTVVTFHTTLTGWRAILPPQRNLTRHRAWMIRSFALTASAITFRLYHLVGNLSGVAYETNYIVSLWLSFLGNLAVAELLLRQWPRAVLTYKHSPPQLQS